MSNSANVLRRRGQVTKVVEFRCPGCKRGLVLSELEATPPVPGQVPYCHDCLQAGRKVQMVRREYRSGPNGLHV